MVKDKQPPRFIHSPVHTDTAAQLSEIARTLAAKAELSDMPFTPRDPNESLTDHLRNKTLPFARTARQAGVFPEEAAFYLVAFCINHIAEERIQSSHDSGKLKQIGDKIRKVEAHHGLKDDEYFWPIAEGPAEYQALSTEWDTVADGITADTFREYGEEEMAVLYEGNRNEFDRRSEVGRQFFHPNPSLK